MENKYYIPEIEDLHVGLEIEVVTSTVDTIEFLKEDGSSELVQGEKLVFWAAKTVSPFYDGYYSSTIGIADAIIKLQDIEVRVKYLDQENIESLGWQYFMTNEEQIVYTKFVSIKRGDFNAYLHHVPYTNWVLIYLEDVVENHTLFAGEIKNKSELSKLIKQLTFKDGK